MRIYDGDFTVGRLIEECATTSRRASNLNLGGREPSPDIDIDKLNRCLAQLPIPEIRRRRARMNTFYEEVLVSSDPDRGIQFTSLLMILAHHKVINDNKSLRYVQFTKKRQSHYSNIYLGSRNSYDAEPAYSVWKRLSDATSSWVSLIPCTGLVGFGERWSRRSRAAWQPCQRSTCRRSLSMTRTLQMRSVGNSQRAVVRSFLLPIYTLEIGSQAEASTRYQVWIRRCAVDQTRFKSHPQAHQPEGDRCHRRHHVYHHSHHQPIQNGILHRLLLSVDRPAHSRSNSHQQTPAAGQIAQSAQPTFWKSLIALLGARVFAGVSHSDGSDTNHIPIQIVYVNLMY